VERGLIDSSPFAKLKGANVSNASRQFFVTREMTTKLLDACPDSQWRLIVALTRYGGLRCPSEIVELKLSDVDRDAERVRITSPKTEHLQLRSRIQRQYTIGRKHHPLVCRIDVIDNGPGIKTDIIENIFYPMITGRAEGTGLGLTISQHLIHQHNGLIECHSEPGNTRFSLYLPMEAQHAEV
jgi:integrase